MKTLQQIMIALASVTLCGACQWGNNTLPMADVLKTDSVGARIDDGKGLYHISAEFAKTPAIAEWMSEMLGGTYEGDYLDGSKMMDYYVGEQKKNMLKDFEVDIDDEAFEERASEFQFDARFVKDYETPRYVTYNLTEDIYCGGAHGSYLIYGQTFRKSDGRRITWDILKDQYSDEFQGILKDGLKEYFEVDSDEKLQECFLNPDHIYLVPLPQQPPFFKEDGVHFVYQQYEIAAYAFGLPSFVVSYDRIRPFLNVTGQRLIGE